MAETELLLPCEARLCRGDVLVVLGVDDGVAGGGLGEVRGGCVMGVTYDGD